MGVPQTGTITKAAVEAAMHSGYGSIAREELRAHELAAWITETFTGVAAYGFEDDSAVYVITTATGTGAYLNVTGGTLNTVLGFPAGAVVGLAQTQSSKDTSGWIDLYPGYDHQLSFFGGRQRNSATGLSVAMPAFVGRRYGTGIYGETYASSKYGTVTHNAGGTTFTFTFATNNMSDEVDTNYSVRAVPVSMTAAVATGGLQLVTVTKATDKIDFTVAADPATGNVTWGVEVIR